MPFNGFSLSKLLKLYFYQLNISFTEQSDFSLQKVEESSVDVKKERSSKTKERKEKLSDEEKDARKERKLGRKRVIINLELVKVDMTITLLFFFQFQERMEENLTNDHKRRREGKIYFVIGFITSPRLMLFCAYSTLW